MNTNLALKSLGRNPLQVPVMGLGGAPFANLYRPVSEQSAIETIQYAFEQGVRLFDTAPLYGLGLSEERLGKALAGIERDAYVIATKIGRVLNDDRSDYSYDYTYDGVMRSLDGSLERLGLDSVDILHIHEADPATSQREALETAYPAVEELRHQGVVKAIGAGMNEWQSLEYFVHHADFDLFLLAGRYTLLEQTAEGFLDLCGEKGIGILLAGVYNSGILATGPMEDAKYNYQTAPDHLLHKARAIEKICQQYHVPLHVAALQFAASHPAVTSLVVGAETAAEVAANLAGLQTPVSNELWTHLRKDELLV
ncbi:aldo/keto reductase [Chloroflexi bacterium TSY]|nr:aldo/keto reductase [Chloroflexi bacterium TSY]